MFINFNGIFCLVCVTSPLTGQGRTPRTITVATAALVPAQGHAAAPLGGGEGRLGHRRRTIQGHVRGRGQGLVPVPHVAGGGGRGLDRDPRFYLPSALPDERHLLFHHLSCNCTSIVNFNACTYL